MISFEDFKKDAEMFGISLSQWDYIRSEYMDAIEEARSKHKKRSHLVNEWNKIDAYYSDMLKTELDELYSECMNPFYLSY